MALRKLFSRATLACTWSTRHLEAHRELTLTLCASDQLIWGADRSDTNSMMKTVSSPPRACPVTKQQRHAGGRGGEIGGMQLLFLGCDDRLTSHASGMQDTVRKISRVARVSLARLCSRELPLLSHAVVVTMTIGGGSPSAELGERLFAGSSLPGTRLP